MKDYRKGEPALNFFYKNIFAEYDHRKSITVKVKAYLEESGLKTTRGHFASYIKAEDFEEWLFSEKGQAILNQFNIKV